MFIDASAFCAILLDEADGPEFMDKIEAAGPCLTSAMAIMETTLALIRDPRRDVALTRERIRALLREASIRIVEIGAAESESAIDAYVRFGKGRHPARLNMGDCFAYACARTHGVPLLFKGEDFVLTDVAAA